MDRFRTTCEVLLLTCIDFRFPCRVARYMRERGLEGNYDLAILPGASLGVNRADKPHWNQTFADIMNVAVDAHKIKKVIIMDHEDCLAYRRICGCTNNEDVIPHRVEHKQMAVEWIQKNYPQIELEYAYIDLDGRVSDQCPLEKEFKEAC